VVRIGLFGGVSAESDDGVPLDIGPAKCQAVLAVLALSAGSAVPVSRLVDLVWGDTPPRTAEKTLQSYVVRLRAGLGADAIVRTGAAYRLAVPADAVDVSRFRRQLDSGAVDAALGEWTGTPLAGLDAHGLTPIVDGLVEQWLGAVETDLARRVETDAPGAIGPLTELTADYPFREGLWSLLMTALYRVGRQADALSAFQQARGHLVDQLGVEPGPQLMDLESRILDHDERLRGGVPSQPAAARPTGTVTFGFCEVEDAARLWAANRKKTAAAMARLDELVRAAVNRQGGFLFAIGGESFGAAFHRADDAAAWATELQLAVSSEPWPGGVEPRLRIGLHTGETDEAANGYFGAAVKVAERLTAAGHGRQTLVSAVTSALLDRSDLPDLGGYRLDGDPAEQHIFQLGPGKHPALRGRHHRPGNIPPRLGRLIGRDQDLDIISRALAQSPVVTLVGPGGIGKTRLALAAAQLSELGRTGAWLFELTSITSSSDVPRVVADTLGVKEHPGRTLIGSVVAALQSRPALLVLDNCEHVVDGAARFAHAIAQGCPLVRLLATSREALGIDDEQLLPVAPLDPAGPAAELFNERARAVCATFDPAASRADVEEICRRLDGIPLAIELAAARSRTLTPPDLLARLGDRLHLLTGGRRTGAERHRTLRATIGWSYDLLTRPQQVLLQRLSIFAGLFDVAAAGCVASGSVAVPPAPTADADLAAVDDLLGELVERSMLLVEGGRFGRRFRLLETIREFAAEQLSADDDAVLIAGRHARWCLDQVTGIHRLLIGPAEAEGVARLAELWPNLRAGFDWACGTGDRELADALVRPVVGEVNLRQQTEISDWAERILTLRPPTDKDGAAFWLVCVTYRCKQGGDHDRYERLVDRYGEPTHPLVRYTRAYVDDDGESLTGCAPDAVVWLRGHGHDFAAELAETGGVAAGLMKTGRFPELDAFVSALAARYRTQGPPTLLYVALSMLGYSALLQGKPDLADRFFDEAVDVDVPDRTVSVNKPIEARAAFRRGNRSAAFRILRGYVDELLETDYPDLATNVAVEFINMMATIDRLPAAARVLDYLTRAGDFGALAARTLVADAAARIDAARIDADVERIADQDRSPEPRLDARHALTYMRDVLDELEVQDQRDRGSAPASIRRRPASSVDRSRRSDP
jgi:predicted ATPase/DNA-binding SARP family transcriptional activator